MARFLLPDFYEDQPSSLVKSHLNTHNSVKYKVVRMKISNNRAKYEVLIQQYLRSILDISLMTVMNESKVTSFLSPVMLLSSFVV